MPACQPASQASFLVIAGAGMPRSSQPCSLLRNATRFRSSEISWPIDLWQGKGREGKGRERKRKGNSFARMAAFIHHHLRHGLYSLGDGDVITFLLKVRSMGKKKWKEKKRKEKKQTKPKTKEYEIRLRCCHWGNFMRCCFIFEFVWTSIYVLPEPCITKIRRSPAATTTALLSKVVSILNEWARASRLSVPICLPQGQVPMVSNSGLHFIRFPQITPTTIRWIITTNRSRPQYQAPRRSPIQVPIQP